MAHSSTPLCGTGLLCSSAARVPWRGSQEWRVLCAPQTAPLDKSAGFTRRLGGILAPGRHRGLLRDH
eukprot:8723132-Lingulodinium_polyedra.AAC.1